MSNIKSAPSIITGIVLGLAFAMFFGSTLVILTVHPEPFQKTIGVTLPMFGTMLVGLIGVLAARCNFSMQSFVNSIPKKDKYQAEDVSKSTSFKSMTIEAKVIYISSIVILIMGTLMLGLFVFKTFNNLT